MDPVTLRLPQATLSAVDEVALATAIEAGLIAADARRRGGRSDATDAELAALQRIGEQATRRFVESNLRLVTMVTRREAARSRMAENELFQEGCVGLIEAVRRFDHRRGPRFATYALHWIRAYVGALTANRGGELNLSSSQAERARELRGAQAWLCQQLGRMPTDVELAAAVGHGTAWVMRMLAQNPVVSLDDQEDGDLEVVDEQAAEEFERVLRRPMPGRWALSALEGLERRVIELRFGFVDNQEHPTTEVARRLGISRTRARRYELRALDRLRETYPQQAADHLSA